MIRVKFPDAVARVASLPCSELGGDGETLKAAIENICEEHGPLQQHLFYANGNLKEHFLLTCRGEVIRLDQKLPDNSHVEIMLATSGGSGGGLSNEEVRRYARHITLPGVGREGQAKLKNAKALIIGTGGLGSPISLYLAAAGVGVIGLVDFDVVEMSNLQRQVVHGTNTIGMPKVNSAKARLNELNPAITVETYDTAFSVENALDLVGRYDVVLDGSDNFNCRYIVNDACAILKRPLVYGAIYRFEGQVSVFNHDGGPCYRCLFPQRPPTELSPSCNAGGVFGVLPGVIGAIQATEAVKLILGLGHSLSGRLVRYDALEMKFDEIRFSNRANCPDCGSRRSQMHPPDRSVDSMLAAPRAAELPQAMFISPTELAENLDRYVLLDVRDPNELEICAIPGSLNVPLADLVSRFDELPRDRAHCIICHSGARAKSAAAKFIDAGVCDFRILEGGIKRWVRDVEPTMPIY
ncbi:MAG TPA: molybdopterin-synthase adenylyltransferase MoeB [Rhodopseudomonas sp.]|uniref:molybdopterin-synthase adenylyltransferase MoeB n=1 Tax=Rhodopseudomonas sp. TaxID=1078 RepID=UPI002EDA7AF0